MTKNIIKEIICQENKEGKEPFRPDAGEGPSGVRWNLGR